MKANVSVIIPVYNRLALLTSVLECVFAQTLPVLEVILIDDGSTEHRPEDVEQLINSRSEWRNRIRYRYQENQGQSVALNLGIGMAKGDWLAFNGSDDLWLPQKLEWQLRALDECGDECGFCFTDAWFMNNPYMKMTVFQRALREFSGSLGVIRNPVFVAVDRNPVWAQTVIAKTEIVRRIGGFDSVLRYSEDHDFTFRMALETSFCYVNMPMVLIDRAPADIRHVGEARNWHKVEFCLRMDQHRFEKQLSLSDGLPTDVCRAIRANLRSVHSHWATCHLRNRDYSKAVESMRTAARYNCTANIALKWMLTRVAPKLTRTIFMIRDESGDPRHDRASWRTA